jgi:hypothetical protein
MNSTIAIVQPFEHMSVAEQKYVLAEYAKDAGVAIDYFIGDDDILLNESPVFNKVLDSVKEGLIKRILLLQGINEKLPKGFCEACKSLGVEVCPIALHKPIVFTG